MGVEKAPLHVSPSGSRGWTVLRSDTTEPLSVHATREEAVAQGGIVARLEKLALIVHRCEATSGMANR